MDKNALVVKSNALIETSYRLTTNEQRIVLACIAQVRRDEPITDKIMYEISATDFSELCGVTLKSSYRELKQSALKLKRREVRITQEPNGHGRRKKTLVTGWVQSIEYSDGEGLVSLRFNHDILPYLTEISGCYTKYKLKNVVRMSSTYGARIYELLIQWLDSGEREVSVEWLREVLQIKEKYKAMNNFKARVLEPAIKDINNNSDLKVGVTQRKTGTKVTHLKFKFKLKETSSERSEIKILGIKKSIIEKNARPGENYEQVAARIKNSRREKHAST